MCVWVTHKADKFLVVETPIAVSVSACNDALLLLLGQFHIVICTQCEDTLAQLTQWDTSISLILTHDTR